MTAMQELREFVRNGYDTHQELIDKIKELLEKEKQQIIDAVNLPRNKRWYNDKEFSSAGEQYYNEKYNK